MLLDHFNPPLSERRHWHSFHNAWATYISSQLNQLLPEGYFAEANVQYDIEIDVAAFDKRQSPPRPLSFNWTPREPDRSLGIVLGEPIVEINVFRQLGGPMLAGVVELVSPSNKDRPASREAFVSKCAAYIQQGVGLVIVDVVTERTGDLHAELLARFGSAAARGAELYVAAYRPIFRDERTQLDVWHEPLGVGRALPTMPLWLRGSLCFPVDLSATYERTCREQKLVGV